MGRAGKVLRLVRVMRILRVFKVRHSWIRIQSLVETQLGYEQIEDGSRTRVVVKSLLGN